MAFYPEREGLVFNATFNNISVISWRSVLLMEEIRVPWENHRLAASHWQSLSHNVILCTPRLNGFRTHNGCGDKHADCIYSCESNYHTITTIDAPISRKKICYNYIDCSWRYRGENNAIIASKFSLFGLWLREKRRFLHSTRFWIPLLLVEEILNVQCFQEKTAKMATRKINMWNFLKIQF
jgi:hypothetical protein